MALDEIRPHLPSSGEALGAVHSLETERYPGMGSQPSGFEVMLDISLIRRDGGTQSRVSINEAVVADYAEAMADESTVFPPVVVYFDGKEYWLADGFHRIAAWERAGREEIPADVRQGDRRQAILHSVAANSTHGLRRSNEDKRRAVLTLLEDREWSQWSHREIARRCAVHHEMVGRLRGGSSLAETASENRTYTTKHGTKATMNTAKIGAVRTGTDAGLGKNPAEAQAPGVADVAAPERNPGAPLEREAMSNLTRDALEEDVIGLKAELTEAKLQLGTQKAEIESLQAKLRDALNSDSGAVILRLTEERDHEKQAKWHAMEELRQARKVIHAQKNRISELERMQVQL